MIETVCARDDVMAAQFNWRMSESEGGTKMCLTRTLGLIDYDQVDKKKLQDLKRKMQERRTEFATIVKGLDATLKKVDAALKDKK